MPRREAPRQFFTISQKVKISGVFWTKFECISDTIRRILTTNRTRGARGGLKLPRTLRLRGEANECALDTLADSRVQKPKNFLAFFSLLLPPIPPLRSGKRNGKEIFGFASLFQSPKRASIFITFWLLFSPFSRRPRRPSIRVW